VWEWDGINWTQAPTTSAPADRAQHAMAHDWALQRTMVFGGGDSRGAKLNDSWSWDGNGWTQLTPTTSPQARVWHALADDPNRRRTILFGGSTTTNVADTWEWDGVAWVQINTPTTPPARNAHAMAYDSIRRRLVVFGGRAPAYLSDTWEYDGDAALRVDTATISIATGGTQQFTLNAGSWHGSRLFWVFGSLSGTTPGVNLPTSSGSIHIPLNPDVWTDLTISLANTPTLTGTKAALDQQGQALASLNVPVITSPSAIGVTFHHAYLVYDAQGNYYLASNPVSLRLIK
jgi:hypothetical protein